MMIFGTLIFFQWQTVHLDFPIAAKKQSRPADTGAHENPHTAVKNKECWDTPRVNKADTAIFDFSDPFGAERFFVNFSLFWARILF